MLGGSRAVEEEEGPEPGRPGISTGAPDSPVPSTVHSAFITAVPGGQGQALGMEPGHVGMPWAEPPESLGHLQGVGGPL